MDVDVLIIDEQKPTDEQKERALKLGLPPTFFLYENKFNKTRGDGGEIYLRVLTLSFKQ